MEVLRLNDVGPDGVRFIIDWDNFKVSDSVFIPCLNVGLGNKQVRGIFERRQWGIRVQVRTESYILGLRIWRTA